MTSKRKMTPNALHIRWSWDEGPAHWRSIHGAGHILKCDIFFWMVCIFVSISFHFVPVNFYYSILLFKLRVIPSLSLYRLDQLCSICRDGRPCMCTNEEKEMWYFTALSNANKIDLGYNWLPGFGLWHHIIKAFVKTPARLNTTSTADWFYKNMILPPNHPTPPNHPGLAFNVTPIRPTVSDSFS